MSDKITLATVSELQAFPSAAAAINSNSAIITAAMDNTLSRDGTQPNQMAANLDMNSNRILNLPTPVSNLEPARLVDIEALTGGGTITINPVPTGGTTGQVLAKKSNSNFDTGWVTEIPVGGTTGQALVKNSNTDLDTKWGSVLTFPGTATNNAAVTLNTSTSALQKTNLLIDPTTNGLSSTGNTGVPIKGRTDGGGPTPGSGMVGEYISNVIPFGGGINLSTGSAGQVWNSITLSPGMWLVGAQPGVVGMPIGGASATVFTHMHAGYGVGITTIPTTPGAGCVTALHIQSFNPNGWIFPSGPTPLYLSTTSTVNAVMTTDFTGGTATAYGTLWAIRFA